MIKVELGETDNLKVLAGDQIIIINVHAMEDVDINIEAYDGDTRDVRIRGDMINDGLPSMPTEYPEDAYEAALSGESSGGQSDYERALGGSGVSEEDAYERALGSETEEEDPYEKALRNNS